MSSLAVEHEADGRASPTTPPCVNGFAAAGELITTRFSWEAAVARWEEFIADLEDSCSGSTGGHGHHLELPVRHRREHPIHRGALAPTFEFDIFADVDAEVIDPVAELGVSRTWKDRWQPDLPTLEEALRLTDAEVVHVQFNFGFFEFQRMADLIERQLESRGVVVTLHRTRDYDDRGDLLSLRQIAGHAVERWTG